MQFPQFRSTFLDPLFAAAGFRGARWGYHRLSHDNIWLLVFTRPVGIDGETVAFGVINEITPQSWYEYVRWDIGQRASRPPQAGYNVRRKEWNHAPDAMALKDSPLGVSTSLFSFAVDDASSIEYCADRAEQYFHAVAQPWWTRLSTVDAVLQSLDRWEPDSMATYYNHQLVRMVLLSDRGFTDELERAIDEFVFLPGVSPAGEVRKDPRPWVRDRAHRVSFRPS